MNKSEEYRELTADSLIKIIKAKQINSCHSVLFNKDGNSIKDIYWYRIEGQRDTRNTNYYTYFREGKLKSKEEYIAHGIKGKNELFRKSSFNYNQFGRMISSCLKQTDMDNTTRHCASLTYTPNDILIESTEIQLETGDTIRTYRNIINKNGIIMSRNNGIEKRILDKDGRLIKQLILYPYGEPKYTIIYEHDKDGNIIQKTNFDENDVITSFKNYVYNEDNLIMEEEKDIDSWNINFFGDNKKLIKSQYYSLFDSVPEFSEITYEYDSLNNLKFRKRIALPKKHEQEIDIEFYQYIYDYQNNWIEKKRFRNNLLLDIERRQILYYE